jgi:hypothetical protein
MNCPECGHKFIHWQNNCNHQIGRYHVVHYGDGETYVHDDGEEMLVFGKFLFKLTKPIKLDEERIDKLILLL